MGKRILYLIVAISLIANAFTFNISYSLERNKDLVSRVYTNKGPINQGAKGIDYNISYIFIEHASGYKLDRDKFDPNKLDQVVKILVNGQEEDPLDSKGNRKYTVDYNSGQNRLEIRVKEGQSNQTHLRPFILKKHSHYNIHIPKGFFTGWRGSSDVINYNFTTRGDGEYGHDIIKSTSPGQGEREIDYENGRITLSFIDDIELAKDAENRKNDYFKIVSEKLTDPAVDNFQSIVEENINNYLIYTEGNRLIFKKKTGQLDDFAIYNISLSKNALFLKNSRNIQNARPISNDTFTINFATNNWIEWTYPYNNQGTEDSQRLERNPLIKIKFKYPVELIDRSKISLSSDGHIYAVDRDKDTWINYDGDMLKIDINSLYRAGENPLRANTSYKLTIGQGALRLRDHNIVATNEKMENQEINLYFITGEDFKAEDPGLEPIKYTSSLDINHDDITGLNTTKLGRDASIYIHFATDSNFPRHLQWNQWTAEPKVKTDEDALKYFKLYKIPKAYKRDHDSNGMVYDKELRYKTNGVSLPTNGLDEIPLKSVEIIKDQEGRNTNILKISPKYDLIPYNKYVIGLDKRDILTDNYEKIISQDDRLVSLGQVIWTAPTKERKTPNWEMDKITSQEIIEIEKGPYKTGYLIHGAANYSQDLPINLYVDEEVIPNPQLLDPLNGITLFEGYGEGDTSESKRSIHQYSLEYYFEKGRKKTKISLYPQASLDSGKYYQLDIAGDVFSSRSGDELGAIGLKFVVEGDHRPSQATGIYKFELDSKEALVGEGSKRPLLITDFHEKSKAPKNPVDPEFTITGYNFTEDIKGLRFVRRPDGKTISLGKEYLEFVDVTKIKGSIGGQAKADFARVYQDGDCGLAHTSAGSYDIYIDFANGKTAGLDTISQRFIIKDRPKIIATNPYDGEDYFNPQLLYREFSDPDEEGYYIKAVFEDIGGTLELNIASQHGIRLWVKGEEGTNLVDSNRPLRYERERASSPYSTSSFNLYIPLIDSLKDGQDYIAHFPEGNIINYGDVDTGGNRCYRWEFSTNYYPQADRLYEGSVPERYDWRYPLLIEGSNFHYNTRVLFRSANGSYYYPDGVRIRDNLLYVYLPRRRLAPGSYDIIISNGIPYEVEMVYGLLSVVEEGDQVPNEDYRIKDESNIGTVKEDRKTSQDILEIDRKHRDRNYLEIDLDDLMGTSSWVRKIQYPASSWDRIGQLVLKSKWAELAIEDLRLDHYSKDRLIEIRVGRLEPSMADALKNRLVGQRIKSDFIEVSGVNFDFSSLSIAIPYFQSEGEGLRIIRYDERRREFEAINSYTDLIDGRVKGFSTEPGIFLIVEEGVI